MDKRKSGIFRLLLITTGIASAAVMILFGLLMHHSSFDPYGWANPGTETVESRDLWNERKEVYSSLLLISFAIAVTLGVMTGVVWLRSRRNKYESNN